MYISNGPALQALYIHFLVTLIILSYLKKVIHVGCNISLYLICFKENKGGVYTVQGEQ